jgi:hypothetical protein
MPMSFGPPTFDPARGPRGGGARSGAEAAAGSFAQFRRQAAEAKFKATSSKLEKIRLLGGYLGSLPAEVAALAAVFFTGRAFAPGGGSER